MLSSDYQNILKLLKNGDEEGLKLLFQQFYKPLCVQAFYVLEDETEAEDIVQNFFMDFWKERKFEKINGSVAGYLSQSIRNACINRLKQTKRSQNLLGHYTYSQEWMEDKNSMEILEMTEKIYSSINDLPPQCKNIFTMVYIDQKKYREAADLAGISVNTVKTQLKRAFEKLRQSLDSYR